MRIFTAPLEINTISYIKSISFITYAIKIIIASVLFHILDYSADCRPILFQIVKFRAYFHFKSSIHKSRFKKVPKPHSISKVHLEQNTICPTTPADTILFTFFSGRYNLTLHTYF